MNVDSKNCELLLLVKYWIIKEVVKFECSFNLLYFEMQKCWRELRRKNSFE